MWVATENSMRKSATIGNMDNRVLANDEIYSGCNLDSPNQDACGFPCALGRVQSCENDQTCPRVKPNRAISLMSIPISELTTPSPTYVCIQSRMQCWDGFKIHRIDRFARRPSGTLFMPNFVSNLANRDGAMVPETPANSSTTK